MISGLLGGLLWGLDTVIIGIALSTSTFVSTSQAIFLAPFISTFLHDAFSMILLWFNMIIKKETNNMKKALKTKSGKFIMLGALLGGPIGMTGYVNAIKYIGPGYTAILSALFPAVGAILSAIFLKEKLNKNQIIGLIIAIIGVIGLSYTPQNINITHPFLGFFFAILCILGWASEAVIVAYGMKDPNISDENALQIRQSISALFYGLVIITSMKAWPLTINVVQSKTIYIIFLAALFGTTSYLCYYKAIHQIGAAKAMALNITYCAWSLVFSLLLLNIQPTIASICFGILTIIGSLLSALQIKKISK